MSEENNFEIKGKYTTAVVYLPPGTLEPNTFQQIEELTNYKAFSDLPLVVMPDCHAGAGCVIGTTVDMTTIVDAKEDTNETGIIPNIIGVDIGCGVETVNLGHQRINYKNLDKFVHNNIPAGFSKRPTPFSFEELTPDRREYYRDLEEAALELCNRIGLNPNVFYRSIGTLGGGNHFVEIGLADEEDEKGSRNRWLSIHSGSRNPGLQVAKYYQKMAKTQWAEYRRKEEKARRAQIHKLRNRLRNEGKTKKEIYQEVQALEATFDKIEAPPRAAEFLPLHLGGSDYLRDMKLMQKYAEINREMMITRIVEFLGREECTVVRSVHNYINFDDNVLRKGAISAHKDKWVVIPMNMKRGVVIGKGLGNKDWNFSAPHGSGRTMSRTQAKRVIKMQTFERQMEDVYSTCVDSARLDEAPDAYKDADMVCRQIDGKTIQIIYNVKAEYNFKG